MKTPQKYNFIHILYIYVDGSVAQDAGRCAFAFISESMRGETQHAVCVSDLVSSTQAELVAMHQSLLHFQENPTPHSNIVIHSKNSYTLFNKIAPGDLQSRDILDLAQNLQGTQNLSFTLHWIPSQICIQVTME